jgi:hypothetical protein
VPVTPDVVARGCLWRSPHRPNRTAPACCAGSRVLTSGLVRQRLCLAGKLVAPPA